MICGAIFHDMKGSYTGDASLNLPYRQIGGDLSLADTMVVAAAVIPASDDLLLNLRHLIPSYHGEYEKPARLLQTRSGLVAYCDN